MKLAKEVVLRQLNILSDAPKFISSKFSPKYQKCVVVRKTGTSTYDLRDEDGKVYSNISASNIKK